MEATRQGFWSVATTVIKEARSAVVVMSGLLALVILGGVALALVAGRDDSGQQVVMLATSAFGVIGAVVGAYFGVNASANARDAMKEVALGQQATSNGTGTQEDLESIGEVDEAAVYGEAAPVEVSPGDALRAIDEEPLDDELLEEAEAALVAVADEPSDLVDDAGGSLADTYVLPGDGTAPDGGDGR